MPDLYEVVTIITVIAGMKMCYFVHFDSPKYSNLVISYRLA